MACSLDYPVFWVMREQKPVAVHLSLQFLSIHLGDTELVISQVGRKEQKRYQEKSPPYRTSIPSAKMQQVVA